MKNMNWIRARAWAPLILAASLSTTNAVYAASISGTVTASSGLTPIEGISVTVYRFMGGWWDYVNATAITDAAGFYNITGLEGGLYRLAFHDENQNYAAEVYDNLPGQNPYEGGTELALDPDGAITGIDVSLAPGATLSGSVAWQDQAVTADMFYVELYRDNGAYWEWTGGTGLAADGAYEFRGLGPGEYRVVFYDWSGTHVNEVYDNLPGGSVWFGGTNIPVPEGGSVTGVCATLSLPSSLSGRVTGPDGTTPLPFMDVFAYRWSGAGWDWVGCTEADPDGNYLINGLAAGDYRVVFYDDDYQYAPEVYDNIPGEAYWDSGEIIEVAENMVVENINAAMEEYAQIDGTLTGTQYEHMVYLRDATGKLVHFALSRPLTGFTFDRLFPGTYFLHVVADAGSGYWGCWYTNYPFIPSRLSPPDEATPITLVAGETQTVSLGLIPAGNIYGQVTDSLTNPIAGARIKAKNISYDFVTEVRTDSSGNYELQELLPGAYQIKAEVCEYRDEWWNGAAHEDSAATIDLPMGGNRTADFELLPGQTPAFVEVDSTPPGAKIYLDYQATLQVTPARIDVGEVPGCADGGFQAAPHVISVSKPGRPVPPPHVAVAREAETVHAHFDMSSDAAGSLSVVTTPDGAEVFVDRADLADGLTPVIVDQLAPGAHTVLLRKPGYLQPRPLTAWIREAEVTALEVSLVPETAGDRMVSAVSSSPTNARIYVDYLPTVEVTDAVVDWMDPASHSGAGWHAASHVILLRKPGVLPAAPRLVPEAVNETQALFVQWIESSVAAKDEDLDGLPDEWEEAYRLNELAPGESGPDDDPDEDGIPNDEEMGAGTHPLDANSKFDLDQARLNPPGPGRLATFIFNTVPGRRYIVQEAETLQADWQNLSGVILATGSQTTYTVPVPVDDRSHYYRIVVLIP